MKVKNWYKNYWAQTWYRNTFLVSRPDQIAQVIKGKREWNNVYDSGCNFTCLAMIIGIDPARLSSELSGKKLYFDNDDEDYQAERLDGKREYLVWDQNAPQEGKHQTITLNNLWHSQFSRRVAITISFVEGDETRDYKKAHNHINSARKNGLHVICGPETHSYLAAGTIDNDFFLWDPNANSRKNSIEDILKGEITLRRLFKEQIKKNNHKIIQLWNYRVDIT
jgi:hypothetical protein